MKNFKKLMATLMALGMVSTMGVSTFADTIGDSQKTFYTGDVNLDGKVTSLDLLVLKKMLLGLIPMQEMYIDGDALKKVEETQSVVNTSTIKTFENTFIDGGAERNYMGYVVDLEENLIKVQVDTVAGSDLPVYLLLQVTDDTIFNADAKTLEDFANSTGDYIITYNDNQEVTEIAQVDVDVQTPYSYTNQDYNFYFDTYQSYLNIFEKNLDENIVVDPINIQVTDSTIITLDGIPTTLQSIKDAYVNDSINLSLTYTAIDEYIATSIIAESINKDIQTEYITYNGNDIIDSIDYDAKSLIVRGNNTNLIVIYYTNDDTTYSGCVSSFNDLSKYQWCYLSVVLAPTENQNYVNDILMEFKWTINYYKNVDGKDIITNIDVSRVDE